MNRYVFLAAVFFQSLSAGAQVSERKIIHAGDLVSDYFTYRFPSFEDATILFKNGGSLLYKMNFNTFLCTMQFIDSTGDTLAIEKPDDIDSIRLNNSTFFCNDGYYEIIASFDSVKLVVFRTVKFEPVKIGAMGEPSRHTSIDNFVNYTGIGNKAIQLTANYDVYAYLKTEYFLMSGKSEFLKATKSNFLKIFNDDKKRIENFLKLNKPNFKKQNDLEKLFHFCTHS